MRPPFRTSSLISMPGNGFSTGGIGRIPVPGGLVNTIGTGGGPIGGRGEKTGGRTICPYGGAGYRGTPAEPETRTGKNLISMELI